MQQIEVVRLMIRALSDVKETGDTYEMSESWEVTAHAGRPGASLTVAHVVKVELKSDFAVLETSRGHRYVLLASDLHAWAQEPSKSEKSGRKAGFM